MPQLPMAAAVVEREQQVLPQLAALLVMVALVYQLIHLTD
jgi:hypothetical protein